MTFTNPPRLRGHLHFIGTLVSPFALLVLLIIADSPRSFVGAAIFGSALILLHGTSASYHLLRWQRLRSLDHSMIFIFIAATYTPFTLKIMGNGWGITLLSVVWGVAGVGVALTVANRRSFRWFLLGLYFTLGWLALVAVTQLVKALPAEAFVALVISGVVYSIGGVVYATRRPDPWPSVFGYHEVFHGLVMIATLLIYLGIAFYVLPFPFY
jgi:hemolysin III